MSFRADHTLSRMDSTLGRCAVVDRLQPTNSRHLHTNGVIHGPWMMSFPKRRVKRLICFIAVSPPSHRHYRMNRRLAKGYCASLLKVILDRSRILKATLTITEQSPFVPFQDPPSTLLLLLPVSQGLDLNLEYTSTRTGRMGMSRGISDLNTLG